MESCPQRILNVEEPLFSYLLCTEININRIIKWSLSSPSHRQWSEKFVTKTRFRHKIQERNFISPIQKAFYLLEINSLQCKVRGRQFGVSRTWVRCFVYWMRTTKLNCIFSTDFSKQYSQSNSMKVTSILGQKGEINQFINCSSPLQNYENNFLEVPRMSGFGLYHLLIYVCVHVVVFS